MPNIYLPPVSPASAHLATTSHLDICLIARQLSLSPTYIHSATEMFTHLNTYSLKPNFSFPRHSIRLLRNFSELPLCWTIGIRLLSNEHLLHQRHQRHQYHCLRRHRQHRSHYHHHREKRPQPAAPVWATRIRLVGRHHSILLLHPAPLDPWILSNTKLVGLLRESG